jgi:hypothetical protein
LFLNEIIPGTAGQVKPKALRKDKGQRQKVKGNKFFALILSLSLSLLPLAFYLQQSYLYTPLHSVNESIHFSMIILAPDTQPAAQFLFKYKPLIIKSPSSLPPGITDADKGPGRLERLDF